MRGMRRIRVGMQGMRNQRGDAGNLGGNAKNVVMERINMETEL